MLEECVPQQECRSFLSGINKLKEIGDSSGKGSEEYRQHLTKLKELICDPKERTVCCEDSNAVTRKCFSGGGKNLTLTYEDLNSFYFQRNVFEPHTARITSEIPAV